MDKDIIIKLPESIKKKIEQLFIDFLFYGKSALELTDEDINQIEIVNNPDCDTDVCLIPAEEGCTITINPDGSITKTYDATYSPNGKVELKYTEQSEETAHEIAK